MLQTQTQNNKKLIRKTNITFLELTLTLRKMYLIFNKYYKLSTTMKHNSIEHKMYTVSTQILVAVPQEAQNTHQQNISNRVCL